MDNRNEDGAPSIDELNALGDALEEDNARARAVGYGELIQAESLRKRFESALATARDSGESIGIAPDDAAFDAAERFGVLFTDGERELIAMAWQPWFAARLKEARREHLEQRRAALVGYPAELPRASVVEWPASVDGARWVTEAPPVLPALIKWHDGPSALPVGKVGVLAAAGGSGKTAWLLRLAIAVASGQDFDAFKVTEARPVLYVAGEESADELHHRLHGVAQNLARASGAGAYGGEAKHVQKIADAIAGKLHLLSLSGMDARLVESERKDLAMRMQLTEIAMRARAVNAGLIIIDPLARFMSSDGETDSAAATATVRALELLTYDEHGRAGGGPTVLAAHHVPKHAIGKLSEVRYQTAARGSSALTDGARWQGGMVAGENRDKGKNERGYNERTLADWFGDGGVPRSIDAVGYPKNLHAESSRDARLVAWAVSKYNAGPSGRSLLYVQHEGSLYPLKNNGEWLDLDGLEALKDDGKGGKK